MHARPACPEIGARWLAGEWLDPLVDQGAESGGLSGTGGQDWRRVGDLDAEGQLVVVGHGTGLSWIIPYGTEGSGSAETMVPP